MDTISLVPFVYSKMILFVLIFARISSLLGTFIIFRTDYVSPKIIIALSSILSFYVLLYHQNKVIPYDGISVQLFLSMAAQAFIGFSIAFVLNIMFEVFVAVGQIVSMQIGIGMASLLDPKLGSITPLTHFYMYCMMILFLGLNGHLTVIKMLLDSFIAIPIASFSFNTHGLNDILHYAGIIFSGAISLSLIMIVTILMTNLAFALTSRFAPQFNLFSIGINLSLIIGLICTYVTFQLIIDNGKIEIINGLQYIQNLITRMK